MKKTITILLAAIGIMSCGNNPKHQRDCSRLEKQIMTVENVLEELKGKDVVLFVADEDEISQADVPFPVVYTGMGKMRMFSAMVKWYETRADGGSPVILNIGSAGSAKYPIGTILNCTHFVNGGGELIFDQIDVPGDGCSVFSDNLDGSLKDWRSILLEIRSHFTSLLKNLGE